MAFVIWLTGLPCSGKTTISKELSHVIDNLAILDGDELRKWLSQEDFSREGINKHNERVAHLAKLLIQHNVPICVALISPYVENRENARKIIHKNNFVEIFLKCSVEVCEKRDVKGMYKKARNKEIENFIGITGIYETPINPDLIIDTENYTVKECVNKIIQYLKNRTLILK